jgi:hypothetical protein
VYNLDPDDASLLHGTVKFFTTYGCKTRRSFWPAFVQLGDQHPLRSIGERCRDSAAIEAFSDDGKYLIQTHFVPTVITVVTEESGKDGSKVQPIKSSCMVTPDTALDLVEVIRAMVPVVTGTSNLGAPLAMDFSMADGPPASHNKNYFYSCCKTPWRLINSS